MKKPTNSTANSSSPFSQIRISLFEKDSLRALVTCVVSDCIFLTGLRIIEGKNGLFITMASRKTAAGEYQDVYFPASKTARDQLQAQVLEAYREEVGRAQGTEDKASGAREANA